MSPGPAPRARPDALRPAIAAACAPSWRVEGWDTEQGVSFVLTHRRASVMVELERRADDRPCYARTARFNVIARPALDDRPLTDPERAVVDRTVQTIARVEPRLPTFERPTTSRRAEVLEVEAERVLVPEGRGQYYVNPYAGCMIGCAFCYVAERADLSRELLGLPAIPWGHWVHVKTNAAAVLRTELRRHPPGPVRMSPILTDPYQPLERRRRITRGCLEALLEVPGFAPVVLTRAARVLDDRELLARFPRAAVGLSIPTDDDAVRLRFEPGADPIEERLEALASLHAAGVRTFAVIQPILPMKSPEALADRIAPFVSRVRVDRMHAIPRARAAYGGALEGTDDPAWNDSMERRLLDAFAARGVPCDPIDDLRALLGSET